MAVASYWQAISLSNDLTYRKKMKLQIAKVSYFRQSKAEEFKQMSENY